MANLGQKNDILEIKDNQLRTEWDAWNELALKGYEAFDKQKDAEGLQFWQEALDIFESVMQQAPETVTLYGLMASQDYVYPIDGWMQDYEMELGNAGKYEERIAFCQKMLEIFDWEEEDDSCFQCGIGESLFREGKIEDAYEYYENWLAGDPQNVNGINSYSWILSENGDDEKAYEMVREVIWGVTCYADNAILFMRARQLADYVGKEDESKWYKQQLDKFENSIKQWNRNKQIPVVKEKKIYPNDPCPCGSGKKYKKCCGKK